MADTVRKYGRFGKRSFNSGTGKGIGTGGSCCFRKARSMAGLVSPKPISYLQQANSHYNNYARSHQAFSETPPLSTLPHSMPQSQFTPGPVPTTSVHEDGKIYGLVIDLLDPNTRESALLELSKKREQYDDLALVLWHSFGVLSSLFQPGHLLSYVEGIMPALLQEIVSVYPLLSPPNLTAHASNRVCNALALLQCVASHSETRQLFLSGTGSFFSSTKLE